MNDEVRRETLRVWSTTPEDRSSLPYREAIDWLLSFADFERSGRFQDRPDVAPMLALLERLGNPHLGRTTVHIAGSKGKGSVAAMVESILRSEGLLTGLYTSPHLHSYCERIRIDSNPVSQDEIFAFLVEEQLRPAVEAELEILDDRRFVTFDLLTALAFLIFRDYSDIQIVEVGLGGRVDSTNVFETKEVAVITPISLEHTAILGDTVEQIAREKAAIIRPGCTVVMASQPYQDAERVIREFAQAAGAPVIDVGREYNWQKLSHDLAGQDIRIEGFHRVVEARLPLLGVHQIDNAATSIACIDALSLSDREDIFEAGTANIVEGLAHVRWPGRMEVLREHPLVICDGAHNRDSAQRLRETLVDYFACDRALFVIGCGSDKDIDGLAEELAPLASHVIAVRSNHPRAMAPERITEAFGRLNIDSEIGDSVGEAVDKAIAVGGESALICVAGSLFVAAEAREHFGLTTA